MTIWITTILVATSFVATLFVQADFEITPVPSDAPTGLNVFTKHVDVLGLHVLAKSNVSNSRVLHCANLLAQWIDNDEDGVPDNPAVHQNLVDNYASMLMWWDQNQAEGDYNQIPDSTWDNYLLQDLFGNEVNLNFPDNQEFDPSLEETLHLVTFGGYAPVYPSVWGEDQGTQMANTMDAVIAGGWYHYDDPTCDYQCNATEYFYWSLTSLLGAQNYFWRIPEIANEWELPTPKLMMQHNATFVDMLQDPQWHLPTTLPDGSYNPSLPCPQDLDGNGSVDVGDLLAVITAWGQQGVPEDIDGSGSVAVGDILAIINDWGLCN